MSIEIAMTSILGNHLKWGFRTSKHMGGEKRSPFCITKLITNAYSVWQGARGIRLASGARFFGVPSHGRRLGSTPWGRPHDRKG
jgi:hypothetical protein